MARRMPRATRRWIRTSLRSQLPADLCAGAHTSVAPAAGAAGAIRHMAFDLMRHGTCNIPARPCLLVVLGMWLLACGPSSFARQPGRVSRGQVQASQLGQQPDAAAATGRAHGAQVAFAQIDARRSTAPSDDAAEDSANEDSANEDDAADSDAGAESADDRDADRDAGGERDGGENDIRRARDADSTEPSAAGVALALEAALVDAIATAERSVVSIARVSRVTEDEERQDRFDRPGIFGRGRMQMDPPKATDLDFVPNEFATGVVIDASGLILTNYHVVDEESDHYVTTVDRKVFATSILAADPRSDLAVLKVEDAVRKGDFVPIKFGDASRLRKGQFVISLGNPYAIARDGQASASWGIISNLQRKEAPGPEESDTFPRGKAKNRLQHFGTLIQTDARLNLGTSGGALLNLHGEMVGLTTSLAALAGFEQSAGYAIPVDETFQRILEQLRNGREVEYGLLGILPENLRVEERRLGEQGVRVNGVGMGSPADRAGIHAQDVITSIGGKPIFDADGLMLQVGRLAPATEAIVAIERNGQTLQKRVVLAKIGVRGKKIITSRPPAWRGMWVDYATASEAYMQQRDNWLGGAVLVSDVEQDSLAWKAGLRPGMMISHVATTRTETPEAFHQEVDGETGPVSVYLVEGLDRSRELVVAAE